ncbi:MAG: hypothetical protein RBS51_03270 [Anaerovoracaceae bacterium]|jgi:putative membrane protein|nr:hypothetical protein [Anaerovoracaceae bacterium]
MKTIEKKYHRMGGKQLLSLVIIIALFIAITIPVFGLTESTAKEEVIYVNLNSDGSVDEIYVVNSFELNQAGQIIDYGDYTSFREMTASDGMQIENEKITIDANAGKLYYEGTLNSKIIPWSFEIQYFIDEKEYPAERVVGKTGDLEIKIKVRSNVKEKNPFYDHLTLQVSLNLDTFVCKNIKAEGATFANAGKNKLVSFMILPGRDSDISLTAEVTDFAMEGISINAVPIEMNLDFEEESMFGSKLSELKKGIVDLDDGAVKLMDAAKKLADGSGESKDGINDLWTASVEIKDATSKFVDGTKDLRKGSKELNTGVRDLRKATADLKNGSIKIVDGMNGLVIGTNKLSGGMAEVDDGLGQLVNSAKDLDNGMIGLMGGLEQLATSGPSLNAGAMAIFQSMIDSANMQLSTAGISADLTPYNYSSKIDEILSGLGGESPFIAMITNLKAQLDGYSAFYQGLVDYTSGVSQASIGLAGLKQGTNQLYLGLDSLRKNGVGGLITGLDELENGTRKLLAGTIDLKDGVIKLHDGVIELSDGTSKLLDGVIELEDGSIELNDGMVEMSDGIVKLLDGAVELHDGTVKLYDGNITLAEGTFEFRDKTATIEEDVKAIIKDKINEMMGGDFIPISFVSKKNTNVDSVQFAMQTASIEYSEVDKKVDDVKPELNIFQRLLKLFGL